MRAICVQLFWERLSEKGKRDNPERYCGCFWFHCSSKKFEGVAREAIDVFLRVLKESNNRRFDSYSVRNSVLIISHITFRDCRVHMFSDNLSRNSCKKTVQSYCVSIFFQTLETIDKMRERLNASRPQCPVGLTTLRFPGQFSEVTLAIRLLSIFIIDIFYDTKVYSSSFAIS